MSTIVIVGADVLNDFYSFIYSFSVLALCKDAGPALQQWGGDWFVPPVGTTTNADVTRWTRKTDVELAGPGAGRRAGENFGCARVKNYARTDVVCNCLWP